MTGFNRATRLALAAAAMTAAQLLNPATADAMSRSPLAQPTMPVTAEECLKYSSAPQQDGSTDEYWIPRHRLTNGCGVGIVFHWFTFHTEGDDDSPISCSATYHTVLEGYETKDVGTTERHQDDGSVFTRYCVEFLLPEHQRFAGEQTCRMRNLPRWPSSCQ